MRKRCLPNLFLFLLLLLFGVCAAQAEGKFVPPPGKTLLLVGQDRETIARYVQAVKSVPGGVMLYSSIQKADGLEKAADNGSGWQDGNRLLKSYPHSAIQLGLYMAGALEDTIVGKYDENINKLARWLKKANRPVYLRIGYEFDNPQNRYSPEEYREAFRHVVDSLRKQGVRNVAYVWHYWTSSYARYSAWDLQYAGNGNAWMNWYPGDDYVDWFGVSIFATDQLPQAARFCAAAREHHKPFMIAESSPNGLYIPESKLNWFKHIFSFIEKYNVEAFCYIDSDWDTLPMFQNQGFGDARVYKDPRLKKLWLQEIKAGRYLKASPDLFRSLGWE